MTLRRDFEEAAVKLFRISQSVNGGYDTYSDAIVAAETPEAAVLIHPGGYYEWENGRWWATRADGTKYEEGHYGTWSSPDQVTAEEVGIAAENIKNGDIVCASFHAG